MAGRLWGAHDVETGFPGSIVDMLHDPCKAILAVICLNPSFQACIASERVQCSQDCRYDLVKMYSSEHTGCATIFPIPLQFKEEKVMQRGSHYQT